MLCLQEEWKNKNNLAHLLVSQWMNTDFRMRVLVTSMSDMRHVNVCTMYVGLLCSCEWIYISTNTSTSRNKEDCSLENLVHHNFLSQVIYKEWHNNFHKEHIAYFLKITWYLFGEYCRTPFYEYILVTISNFPLFHFIFHAYNKKSSSLKCLIVALSVVLWK